MESTETLIYGFDPLCGWCFAFRPSLAALRTAYPDLPITLRYGGLVTGERVAPIAASRDYLRNGLEQVRQTAGVAAGAAFYEGLLAEGTYVSNSEPPCRAIWAIEQLAPAAAYAFADRLPEAFYVHGRPLDDPAVLSELAAAEGVDAALFLELWQSDTARNATQVAFRHAQQAGFTTYPTLVYQRGDATTTVVRGFLAPDALVARISALRTVEVMP
jgi:putative protein-disulfide isomerase